MKSASYMAKHEPHRHTCRCECSGATGLIILLYKLGLEKALSTSIVVSPWELEDAWGVAGKYRRKRSR